MNKRQMKKLLKQSGNRRFAFGVDNTNALNGILGTLLKKSVTYEISSSGDSVKVLLDLPKGFNSWKIGTRWRWLLQYTEGGYF